MLHIIQNYRKIYFWKIVLKTLSNRNLGEKIFQATTSTSEKKIIYWKKNQLFFFSALDISIKSGTEIL